MSRLWPASAIDTPRARARRAGGGGSRAGGGSKPSADVDLTAPSVSPPAPASKSGLGGETASASRNGARSGLPSGSGGIGPATALSPFSQQRRTDPPALKLAPSARWKAAEMCAEVLPMWATNPPTVCTMQTARSGARDPPPPHRSLQTPPSRRAGSPSPPGCTSLHSIRASRPRTPLKPMKYRYFFKTLPLFNFFFFFWG